MAFQSTAPGLEAALDACPYRSMILPASWPSDLPVPEVGCVVQIDGSCLDAISMELLAETVDETKARGRAVLIIADNKELRDTAKRLLIMQLEARTAERQRHATELLLGGRP